MTTLCHYQSIGNYVYEGRDPDSEEEARSGSCLYVIKGEC